MFLSHIIYVHFDCLSFHIHITCFVLALEREKSRVTPPFLISVFSSKRVTAPPDFSHPQHDPAFLPVPFLFQKEGDPTRLQHSSRRPPFALPHSIIIFSGLFSNPHSSNGPVPPFIHCSMLSGAFHPAAHNAIQAFFP